MNLEQSFMLWHWAIQKTETLCYDPKMQWSIDAGIFIEDPVTKRWYVDISEHKVQIILLHALNNVALFLLIQKNSSTGFLHLSYGGKYANLKNGEIMEIFATVIDKNVAPINELLDVTSRLNHMLDKLRIRFPGLYSNQSRFQCVIQYVENEPLAPTYPLNAYQNISGTLAWWEYGATPNGVKHDPYVAYAYTQPLTLRELKILVYGSASHQLIFKDLAYKKTWATKTLQKIHPKLPLVLDILNSLHTDDYSLWLQQFNRFLETQDVVSMDVDSSMFA